MTYRTRSGRQFVVIATGAGRDAALVALAVHSKAVGSVLRSERESRPLFCLSRDMPRAPLSSPVPFPSESPEKSPDPLLRPVGTVGG